jgi:hypothetical protein
MALKLAPDFALSTGGKGWLKKFQRWVVSGSTGCFMGKSGKKHKFFV